MPLVTAFGGGGFRLNDARHEGSVLLLPQGVVSWPVVRFEDLTPQSFAPVLDHPVAIDIFIIGCGTDLRLLPPDLRALLREKGLGLEVQDTRAACRTYNFLLAEGRRIGAALIAIP